MTKKKLISIATTALAVIMGIVMVLVTWHNIKTANSNNRILEESLAEMGRLLDGILTADSKPKMLAFVRENKPRAVKAANDLRAVCDYFEKITVPNSLKDELAEVRAGIPGMRDYLDKFEAIFGEVMLESELKASVHAAAEAAQVLDDEDGFLLAEQRFINEMRRLSRRRRGRLIWI